MKKIWVFLFASFCFIQSCKRDDQEIEVEKEVESISEQNANDDAAILKFMNDHYLDNQGIVTKFDDKDPSDDHNKKLSELNHQVLPSGVIVIKKKDAQPINGKDIGVTDVLRLMSKTSTFLSKKNNNGEVSYTSNKYFVNTIDGGGSPEVDPYYYYVKKSFLNNGKSRSYYEIEGFQEGLKYFKGFDISDQTNFTLQGVIIVPSRAAYARDSHYGSYRNRTFVFNFQVYKNTPRTAAEQ